MTGRARRSAPVDLDFTAAVEATELRFDEVPESSVVFTGDPGHRSSSGSDRINLPDRVEEGVTYHEVRVDYWISSELTGSPQPDPHSEAQPPARGVASRPE
jgi:hypothetical protein